MLKEITITKVTLDLDGFTLSAEGCMDDVWGWEITETTKGTEYTKSWKREEWLMDEGEVEEYLWEHAMATIRKYSSTAVAHTIEETEVEDEEGEE